MLDIEMTEGEAFDTIRALSQASIRGDVGEDGHGAMRALLIALGKAARHVEDPPPDVNHVWPGDPPDTRDPANQNPVHKNLLGATVEFTRDFYLAPDDVIRAGEIGVFVEFGVGLMRGHPTLYADEGVLKVHWAYKDENSDGIVGRFIHGGYPIDGQVKLAD